MTHKACALCVLLPRGGGWTEKGGGRRDGQRLMVMLAKVLECWTDMSCSWVSSLAEVLEVRVGVGNNGGDVLVLTCSGWVLPTLTGRFQSFGPSVLLVAEFGTH